MDSAAWGRYGAAWPNRPASRFMRSGALRFHVQIMGQTVEKPVLFMLHGTGATTHSWAGIMPLLARDFTVVAPDLPGHGFTEVQSWHSLSLPAMARDLAGLLTALGVQPDLVVGHSAGAAILARMCLDGFIAPKGLVSLNGAFVPFGGAAGAFFAPLARAMVGLPFVAQAFAWHVGNPRMVEKLLEGTGSRLDAAGIAHYARAVRLPGHAAGALRMMASWDLVPLMRDLPGLRPKLLLITGENDRAIPPADADKVAALVPGATRVRMAGLGHLSHEEDPAGTVAVIQDFAAGLP